MLHILLLEPEIPPNTGNIIRLCANTGCILHLIQPLGFTLNDKHLKRAGLDYHEWAKVIVHNSLKEYHTTNPHFVIIPCSTRATTRYDQFAYTREKSIALLFGPETRGLPDTILHTYPGVFIPMKKHSRSLNLSNSVAVIAYEVLRQKNLPPFDKSLI